ncbi:MAG: alpha/beta fold hydrolase [Actinomycetes bacterium]
MGSVIVDGVDLAYDETGAGEPLVLVHGHPFDRSMWAPQVAHRTRLGWRVVTPDLRGYGASTPPSGTTTWDAYARDVAALLDHLGIDRAVLAGLSMGGQIAMEFHRLFPERLRGLVLADTSPVAETQAGRRQRHEVADRLLREGMDAVSDELLPMMVSARTLDEQPDVADHVLRMMKATAPDGAAAALRARAARPDYVAMLAHVSVPTLVVVGREDAYTPVDTARAMAARIPGATLSVVEGAGHLPTLEQPDAFNAALQALLAAVQVESASH